MLMIADMELVREYARTGSEDAFQTLVSRHINLVYSSALRQVGDAHLADDVTQAVFILLARKASSLGDKTILSAWLYRAALFAAKDALKMQMRRHLREHEAYMQSTIEATAIDKTWDELAPCVDE